MERSAERSAGPTFFATAAFACGDYQFARRWHVGRPVRLVGPARRARADRRNRRPRLSDLHAQRVLPDERPGAPPGPRRRTSRRRTTSSRPRSTSARTGSIRSEPRGDTSHDREFQLRCARAGGRARRDARRRSRPLPASRGTVGRRSSTSSPRPRISRRSRPKIGGDRVSVESLAKGYQDPHFVDAKPSLPREAPQGRPLRRGRPRSRGRLGARPPQQRAQPEDPSRRRRASWTPRRVSGPRGARRR